MLCNNKQQNRFISIATARRKWICPKRVNDSHFCACCCCCCCTVCETTARIYAAAANYTNSAVVVVVVVDTSAWPLRKVALGRRRRRCCCSCCKALQNRKLASIFENLHYLPIRRLCKLTVAITSKLPCGKPAWKISEMISKKHIIKCTSSLTGNYQFMLSLKPALILLFFLGNFTTVANFAKAAFRATSTHGSDLEPHRWHLAHSNFMLHQMSKLSSSCITTLYSMPIRLTGLHAAFLFCVNWHTKWRICVFLMMP